MTREDLMLNERLKKIESLRKKGVEPYPYSYSVSHNIGEIIEKNKDLKPEAKTNQKVKVAGRILSIRQFGKINFCPIADSTGSIQLVFEESNCKDLGDFLKFFDTGDFIGVEGIVFKTKRGELSILVKNFQMLSKALKPLPEKWHGLQDKELRYRQRYIDLIINPKIKETFVLRGKIIKMIKEFLDSRGFIEVDTPILQPIYGGAAARPFTTTLNDLKMKIYLRISNELYLKRLLVGGFDKVYEFAKDFRNEGIDRTHNPEFLMVEIYQAYSDYNDMMKLCEETIEYTAKKVLGKTEIEYQGTKINLKAPWQRITMYDAIKKYAKIDVTKMNEKELRAKAEELKIKDASKLSRGLLIAEIFKETCEKNLVQPTFVTDFPKETSPLCKAHRKNPDLIERFEPYINGWEIGNAYSELNDPQFQKKLLEEQAKLLRAGDEEANPYDEDFVNAIEHGMPPTGGLGIGIDRIVMLFTNSESIRDVILFPFMKQNI
jgi:lysyl-tRNA synthetase class 2